MQIDAKGASNRVETRERGERRGWKCDVLFACGLKCVLLCDTDMGRVFLRGVFSEARGGCVASRGGRVLTELIVMG